MSASLDIVIVNWNSGRQLCECLNSIRASARDGFQLSRVVVVDNASTDSSANQLNYPELPLVVIRSPENLGFAAASNLGAKGSLADYLLFLNPDTILESDSLMSALRFMEAPENSRVGTCGIQLLDERGEIVRSCSYLLKPTHLYVHILGLNRLLPTRFGNNFMNDWSHADTREVDVVTGAFLLVRRVIFESLSGFDERYFVYLEDVDFMEAEHRAGWRCYYLAGPRAYHKGGGCSEQIKAKRLYYSLQSRLLYSYKHFGRIAAAAILLGTVLVEPFSRLVLAIRHRSTGEMRETLEAYSMLWRSLPSLLNVPKELKASPQC